MWDIYCLMHEWRLQWNLTMACCYRQGGWGGGTGEKWCSQDSLCLEMERESWRGKRGRGGYSAGIPWTNDTQDYTTHTHTHTHLRITLLSINSECFVYIYHMVVKLDSKPSCVNVGVFVSVKSITAYHISLDMWQFLLMLPPETSLKISQKV